MSLPPHQRRRRVWVFLAGVVLGGIVFAGLLLTPPVQGWLLRRYIARQSGWKIDFNHVGLGPTGLDTRGLAFAMPGVEASTEPFAIRVAPTQLFSKRELRIERVEARKIRLTFTPAQLVPSATPAPTSTPAPFEGVLRLLRAPMPWALDAANLDGEIVVREAGESRLTGSFSLHGGGLAADVPGEFHYELTADSMILPPGPDHKFTSAGTIRLAQTPAHGIARIAIEGDLHLPLYGRLRLPTGHLTLDLAATPTGETYAGHLSLGEAVSLDLQASLDAAHSVLTGHATLKADQSAAASLRGDRLPSAKIAGELTFTLNVRTGDLDAAITGDLDARDWQKLMPPLAALDAFKGRVVAAVTRRGDQVTVKNIEAVLRGEKSAAEARLVFAHPFDPRKLPAGPLAELTLAHWPIEWANPFLAETHAALAHGEFAAAWTVALGADAVLRLEPTSPATLGPIVLSGGQLPSLPALNISFRPQLEASAATVALTLNDFSATTAQGDRFDAQLAFSRTAATGELRTKGEFTGALPSIFARGGGTLPFTLNGSWDLGLLGDRLNLTALTFTARGNQADAPPFLALELLQPFSADLAKRVVPEKGPADLLRLRFARIPLEWLSGWMPGQRISGTLAAGESTVRSAAGSGFALQTTVPWQLQGLSLGAAAAPGAHYELSLSPVATLQGDQVTLRIDGISVTDETANHLSGDVQAVVGLAKKTIAGELAIAAELPDLPHSKETFGPLNAAVHAKFHNVTASIMAADAFDLHLKNATGELLAVRAPLPFLFGLNDSHMTVMTTLAPLNVAVGRFPLPWLRPWCGTLELAGTVAPFELKLAGVINKFSLQATQPVKLENFSARRAGHELVRDATVTVEPGLDLLFLCQTQPVLQIAYAGTVHVKNTTIDVAATRAGELDLDLGFKGNGKINLPDKIALNSRVDFARLPTGVALGLPGRGTLVTQMTGDLLGAGPTEFRVRLEGLPGAAEKESLPPLELMLHGKISPEEVVTGRVELLLGAAPQATDAAFDVNLNLVQGGLNITSGFHSKFLDGSALLAFARAFPAVKPPAGAAKVAKPAIKTEQKPAASSDATLPFWGELEGSFDLDIGELAYGPYRIARVRGRLDADHQALRLHDLQGEMFAGRWSGGLRFDHDPAVTTGDHTLAGEFAIAQFESARVVQAVFPQQLASVDGQINVHSRVASRGNSFLTLLDHSTADFVVEGQKGVVRLTVPKADLVSTAAVFGGTILLSPELRALGRLLKKFAEMPVEQLRITGRRQAGGEVDVDEFVFQSPQARLRGHGRILAEADQPLMNHPLELSLELAAKDELAVILGGMSLLEKKPQADGFRLMRQPFILGGRAGAPDTAPLYDLLAQGVSGSHGTWGFLMRRLQGEVAKAKPAAAKAAP